jgi:hypothetical protein
VATDHPGLVRHVVLLACGEPCRHLPADIG